MLVTLYHVPKVISSILIMVVNDDDDDVHVCY